MARKRRRFTADFKRRVALEALRERDPVQVIAARYEVHPNQVSAWKRQAVVGLEEVLAAGIEAWRGARGDDRGPAREDRRADGGAGLPGRRARLASEAFDVAEVPGPKRYGIREAVPALRVGMRITLLSYVIGRTSRGSASTTACAHVPGNWA